MYLLPITIKKYKTDIDSQLLIRKIRFNTVNQYNAEGYVRQDNPNDLLYRNELEKGIYLKEKRDLSSKYGGGTTVVFITNGQHSKTRVTTIAYFGWQQSIVLALLFLGFIYTLIFSSTNALSVAGGFLVFLIICALFSSKALERQKDLIESCLAEKMD